MDVNIEPADEAAPAMRHERLMRSQMPSVKQQKAATVYILLPLLFLAVALLGGLRFAAADNAFIFLKPALVCLVFAALTLILYFRAGLIALDGWFAQDL